MFVIELVPPEIPTPALALNTPDTVRVFPNVDAPVALNVPLTLIALPVNAPAELIDQEDACTVPSWFRTTEFRQLDQVLTDHLD